MSLMLTMRIPDKRPFDRKFYLFTPPDIITLRVHFTLHANSSFFFFPDLPFSIDFLEDLMLEPLSSTLGDFIHLLFLILLAPSPALLSYVFFFSSRFIFISVFILSLSPFPSFLRSLQFCVNIDFIICFISSN